MGAAGQRGLITFPILKDNAPPGEAVINLLQNAGSTQTALGGSDAQGNNFLFDLEPRPSNVAGDALDGRIIVLPVAGLTNANVITIADTVATPLQSRDNTVQAAQSVSKKGTGTGQELVFPKVFTSIGRSQSPFWTCAQKVDEFQTPVLFMVEVETPAPLAITDGNRIRVS